MKIYGLLLLLLLVPLSAQASYVVIDAQTGRVLSGVAVNEQAPIASLTKMWTALIVLEEAELTEIVTVSKRAALSEGSSIYLQEGDEVTVETLLYGLLLRSGNDAATALAEHVGGSVEGFVRLMNDKAALYGLDNTHFMNPSGLHDDLHLSSAYDTARQLQIALQNEAFLKIASTLVYGSWHNKHRLLAEDGGAVAGKTGYTKAAGRTLATYFERGEKRLIVVTINESDDWRVHRALAEQVDRDYAQVELVAAGTTYLPRAAVTLKQPITLLLTPAEHVRLRHVLVVQRGTKRGLWQIFLGKNRIFATPVQVE